MSAQTNKEVLYGLPSFTGIGLGRLFHNCPGQAFHSNREATQWRCLPPLFTPTHPRGGDGGKHAGLVHPGREPQVVCTCGLRVPFSPLTFSVDHLHGLGPGK